jgi:6-pyruvoyltetrahydropterin/6-carboxytetrahydropterin synthase
MFKVAVRDHVMVAHSFRGEVFGPAQRLHGATFVVDMEVAARSLDADGLVVDIGLARDTLRALLSELDYRNLDDLPAFQGRNTTTEYLCQFLFEQLATRIRAGAFGASERLDALKLTLRESHIAWASYEAKLAAS